MLRGKRILITSGPTRAQLDAVRYLTNISTGRFGCLLAKEARRRGARVTFIHGKGSKTPSGARCVEVVTNQDVARILKKELTHKHYHIVIHAMAVLDFRPMAVGKTKTASRGSGWILHLKPAPKIIARIKTWSPKTMLVGFKLEVGLTQKELLQRARRLLKEAKADFILANQLTEGEDQKHVGWLLDKKGRVIGTARGKMPLAKLIFSALEKTI